MQTPPAPRPSSQKTPLTPTEATSLQAAMSEQPMRSAQCNSLNYTDNRGVEREIYLPQGTMHEAWEHVQHERWGELERFDDYDGQGYTEDDFVIAERLREERRAGGGQNGDATAELETTEQ